MADTIQTVGIAVAEHSKQAQRNSARLCDALTSADRAIMISGLAPEGYHTLAGEGIQRVEMAELAAADLVISLGGDGTLLALARHAAPRGTPLLGVDQGSFGFLAAEKFKTLMGRLDGVLAGEFHVERRVMVSARVIGNDSANTNYRGLNDAVIASSHVGHLVRIHIHIDDEHMASYPADGLIVSTPTGSTGYTLSAGGPIVSPQVESLIITPICSHTLYARPLVVQPTAVVDVRCSRRGRPARASLTVDGQQVVELAGGDTARVERADCDARLVHLEAGSFYERLRTKLHWDADR